MQHKYSLNLTKLLTIKFSITMSDYNLRFKKAIDFLRDNKGYVYTDVSKKLAEFKKRVPQSKKPPGTSESQISRMYRGDKEVTFPTINFIQKYLDTLRVNWNETSQSYEVEEGIEIENENEYIEEKPLKNVKGVYEMYHLSHFSDTILKNIIWIREDGEVCINGYSNCEHRGKAEVFKSSFLSIRIDTLVHSNGKKEKFHYQIFANLDGNMQNGDIFHFFGISTTISITNEAMANKRIFVKLSHDENEQNEDWIHELIYVNNTEAIDKLNESKAGKIADYLLESSTIIIKEKTNQKMN